MKPIICTKCGKEWKGKLGKDCIFFLCGDSDERVGCHEMFEFHPTI